MISSRYWKFSLLVYCLAVCSACGSSSPASPSRTTPTASTPAPPLAQPDFRYGDGTLLCVRGFCSSFTMSLTNLGPGCATNVQVQVNWYGSDGAIPLPNTPSIPMGAPGGLASYIFRPGTTLILTSLGGFNDVRSAHTVYRAAGTWTTIAC